MNTCKISYAKAAVYIMIACICAFAMAGAAHLDMELGLGINLFDIAAKIIIISEIFAYACLRSTPMNVPGSRFLTPCLLVALLPALANTINVF